MRHRKYVFEWWLIFIAIFVAAVSIIADFYCSGYSWFSRSGSIVVLLAAVVEFKISSHIYEDFQRAQYQQTIINLPVPLKAKPTKSRKNLSIATHSLLVFGTIIWGYGDLIWSQA